MPDTPEIFAMNEPPPDTQKPANGPLILIIEDFAELQNVMAANLKHGGFRTLGLHSGDEVLTTPRALLMEAACGLGDESLPGKISGVQTVVLLHLINPLINAIFSIGIPIVWVTHEGGQKAQYHMNTGKLKKPGDLKLGVGGGTGELIQNLVGGVIFIMFDPFKGQRVILTKTQMYDDRRVFAKDRHNIFPKAIMDYPYTSQFLDSYFSYFTW